MNQQITIEEWVERFRAIGLSEAQMTDWHQRFERENPAGHQSFLAWLGLGEAQIAAIRGKYA